LFFKEKGNTTIFEYTYGEVPASIIEPPLNIKADEDTYNPVRIMHLGLFGEEVGLYIGGDIDWEDKGMEQPIIGEIDYNISLEESGIVVEAAGHEGGTAMGSEAYTILDNPTTRSEFINQLFEV